MKSIDIPFGILNESIRQSIVDLENLNLAILQIDQNFKKLVSDECWVGSLRDNFVEKYNELYECVKAMGVFNLELSISSKTMVFNNFLNTENQNSNQY